MLDDPTITVLGKRAIAGTQAEDAVEWATLQLLAGRSTLAVRMLAGSSPPFYSSEIDALFQQALRELGIERPEPESILWQYARLVAQQLIDGAIAAPLGCRVLYDIWTELDSPSELVVWLCLDDAWSDLRGGHEAYSYPIDRNEEPLTLQNFSDVVKVEARRFLEKTISHPLKESREHLL